MPRRAKDNLEKRQRRQACARHATDAKRRERLAKKLGVKVRSDETVRANLVKRAGIPVDTWNAFLRVFERAYKGRFARLSPPPQAQVAEGDPATGQSAISSFGPRR
jgi:hypothetical protein